MKIAILGTGAYGLSLATVFNQNKCNIMMWSKFEEEVNNLNNTHYYEPFKLDIPQSINFTTDLKECVKDAQLIVIAIPTQFVNDLVLELKKVITNKQHILIASKGIEIKTGLFINEIIQKHIKTKKIAVVSGPSFAIDLVNKVPIGLSIGTTNKKTEEIVRKGLETNYLKLRSTKDVLGIEICGAIKNVIAIASGILHGMDLPESTIAMFITESLHDIKQLIKFLGGNKKTILSFAGFGDLLLTCTSTKSRNFSLGYIIGQGKSKEEIDEYIKNNTIEGLYTLNAINDLLKKKEGKLPIINLIYKIVYKNKDKNSLVKFLIEKD